MPEVSSARPAPRPVDKQLEDAFVVSQLLELFKTRPSRRHKSKATGKVSVTIDGDQFHLMITVLNVIVGRANLALAEQKQQNS